MKSFEVISVNISEKKGEIKTPVESILLKEEWGIEGDAHAGKWHRQVSLLAEEDIDIMRAKGAELNFGDFAENITTRGISLHTTPIGTTFQIGEVILELTQIGKECHKGCAIMKQVGDCIMPKRGVFAKVIKGGEIRSGYTGNYSL